MGMSVPGMGCTWGWGVHGDGVCMEMGCAYEDLVCGLRT